MVEKKADSQKKPVGALHASDASKKEPAVEASFPVNQTKLIWQPKPKQATRAAGTVPNIETPTLMDLGVLRKFGPEKDCSPEKALQVAGRRAVELQEEVYPIIQTQIGGSAGMAHNPPGLMDVAMNPAIMQLPCDLALTAPRSGSVLWGKNVFHLDFSMADFSDLEEKTRQLYQLDEGWLFHDEVNPVLLAPQTELHPQQAPLETRWQAHQPDMSERIAPFVRNVMINETDDSLSFHESYVLELDHLAEGGALSEQSNARNALDAVRMKESGRVGKGKTVVVTFGVKMKCTDYAARKISFGPPISPR